MPSDFAKLNLGLTAADLDQAWKDRLEMPSPRRGSYDSVPSWVRGSTHWRFT